MRIENEVLGLDPDEYPKPATAFAAKEGGPLSYKPIVDYCDGGGVNDGWWDPIRPSDHQDYHRPLPPHWLDSKAEADIKTSLYYKNKDGGTDVWERVDRKVKHFLTTRQGGPKWDLVVKRVTQRIDTSVINRTFVEFCCGEESRLGRKHLKPDDTDVVRLTIDDNVSTQHGLAKAIAAVKGKDCLLWASIPCIGGSPWQRINRRKPGGMKRLRYHRLEWKRIWTNFEKVAHECHRQGGTVAIEWPTQCDYWRESCVKRLIEDLKLDKVQIDGCAVGLKSKEGLPIRKPWTIATNHDTLWKVLNGHKCPGKELHPEHQPCEGKHTRMTEEYTDYFARLVHGAHKTGPSQGLSLAAFIAKPPQPGSRG